jgi:acyl-coenzyme A synthetase/AMP-(fatty) acid ligase
VAFLGQSARRRNQGRQRDFNAAQHAIAEMPRTPAGKIQKFQLREQAKVFGNVSPNAAA